MSDDLSGDLREYFAWWVPISGVKVRVEAITAAKAKRIVMQRVEDAGYRPKWIEMRARLAEKTS